MYIAGLRWDWGGVAFPFRSSILSRYFVPVFFSPRQPLVFPSTTTTDTQLQTRNFPWKVHTTILAHLLFVAYFFPAFSLSTPFWGIFPFAVCVGAGGAAGVAANVSLDVTFLGFISFNRWISFCWKVARAVTPPSRKNNCSPQSFIIKTKATLCGESPTPTHTLARSVSFPSVRTFLFRCVCVSPPFSFAQHMAA